MRSETTMVAEQCRLQEWTDQIRECQDRPAGSAVRIEDRELVYIPDTLIFSVAGVLNVLKVWCGKMMVGCYYIGVCPKAGSTD